MFVTVETSSRRFGDYGIRLKLTAPFSLILQELENDAIFVE